MAIAKDQVRRSGAVAKEHVRNLRIAIRKLHPGSRLAPTFLVVGAQKSGTTSLFHYLMKHPQVRQPITKEIHYFDFNYSRGRDWYLAHFPILESAIAKSGRVFVSGEATPYYLCHPDAPDRVKSSFPNMKLIVILRDPVDRAISHYQHERSRHREQRSIREALSDELSRLELLDLDDPELFQENGVAHRRGYLLRGLYVNFLQRWLGQFPREQVLIVESERFFSNATIVLGEIQRFLGLENHSIDCTNIHFAATFEARAPADLVARCKQFFQESNAALFEMLGETWTWK
jgi:hypothetical protein